MKKIGILCIVLGFLLVFAPLIALINQGSDEPLTNEDSPSDETENNTDTPPVQESDIFEVYIAEKDEVISLSALDYITGVVCAEMPALYNDEALKAQAVASYTYAYYVRSQSIKSPDASIKNAHISNQSARHQAYISPEELQQRWGSDFDKYYGKVKAAVSEVVGKLIVYDDEPIIAAFHAMSWGKTEDCENVWGSNVSYLVSVDSSGDESCTGFINTFTFSEQKFKSILGITDQGVTIGSITYTDAGMVDTITINGTQYSGMKIRSLFSLASPCFTLQRQNGNFVFTTKGKGHGVGLSQNGANSLAQSGYSWDEIILHYYRNVTII
ncbi:MAG: stage II sporulation protein D [Clostridia bacterium]|nr:stage II sporulation protein D [Clostridia bacterium]